MSQQDKPHKISKLLRSKAQEFLSSRKYSDNLVDIIKHFESGMDMSPCLLTLEFIFTNLLKHNQMYIEIVPLKPIEKSVENQYKTWLRSLYEEVFNKILDFVECAPTKIQLQGLSTAMNLLAFEGRFPLEIKGALEHTVPINKLKLIIMKMLSNKTNNAHLVNKFEEYLAYDDILFHTWKLLPSLTAKSNPNDIYIMNFLLLLGKLHINKNQETQLLCGSEDAQLHYNFDESITKRSLNKIWNCVMLWEHTPSTHKQLLIVLLEKVLPYLDKPLMLTDFLMDSLDVGGPVSLLALQGIFIMIQTYNLTYPNIFAKLYSMFEPEIFHTKFKARLFYLSDMFLSSTHLPESMVAAFAKRLARLALIAPSEDIIIICMFIGNLILRHQGLKCLLNHANGNNAVTDPYIMEERDPVKSNAINSSLWEIRSLQQHIVPSVAIAAQFINSPLPTVEWDLSNVLDNTGDDIFDKEIKKYSKLVILAFDRPHSAVLTKGDRISEYWNI